LHFKNKNLVKDLVIEKAT